MDVDWNFGWDWRKCRPNTSERLRYTLNIQTVNGKLYTVYIEIALTRMDQAFKSTCSAIFRFGTVRLDGSREAKSAAKRTQFLFAALASYIAVSAHAISCWGDEACFGNAATPKLAVNESCSRRPPVKL